MNGIMSGFNVSFPSDAVFSNDKAIMLSTQSGASAIDSVSSGNIVNILQGEDLLFLYVSKDGFLAPIEYCALDFLSSIPKEKLPLFYKDVERIKKIIECSFSIDFQVQELFQVISMMHYLLLCQDVKEDSETIKKIRADLHSKLNDQERKELLDALNERFAKDVPDVTGQKELKHEQLLPSAYPYGAYKAGFLKESRGGGFKSLEFSKMSHDIYKEEKKFFQFMVDLVSEDSSNSQKLRKLTSALGRYASTLKNIDDAYKDDLSVESNDDGSSVTVVNDGCGSAKVCVLNDSDLVEKERRGKEYRSVFLTLLSELIEEDSQDYEKNEVLSFAFTDATIDQSIQRLEALRGEIFKEARPSFNEHRKKIVMP